MQPLQEKDATTAKKDAATAGKKDATTARKDATTDEAKLERQVAECNEWFSTLGLEVVKENVEMIDDGLPEDIKLPTAREMDDILTEEEVKELFKSKEAVRFCPARDAKVDIKLKQFNLAKNIMSDKLETFATEEEMEEYIKFTFKAKPKNKKVFEEQQKKIKDIRARFRWFEEHRDLEAKLFLKDSVKGMKYVIHEGKKAYNGQFIVKTNDDLDVAVGRKWIFDNFYEKVVKSVMVHGIRDQFFPVQGKKPVLLDNRQITKL